MKEKFKNFGYILSSNFKRLIYVYRFYLIVLGIVFLISFITGILTAINYSSLISCDNLINSYLLSYLRKDMTYLTYFLMQGLYVLIIVIFVMLCTQNLFVIIINGGVLSILSYILGFDVCTIIISLGLSGVIFGVLIYGLLQILVMFNIMIIMSIAGKRAHVKKKNCDSVGNSEYIKMYLIFLMLSLVVLFIHSILFGIIHIFVIVD